MDTARMQRVLVVEDDMDIQTLTKITLSELAMLNVEICGSGTEALAIAPAFAPDLIILDVMMPGMDGPETLKALRALPRFASTPVVFLTARVQPHEIAMYKRLGASDIISKPFEPMELVETLQRIWKERDAGPSAEQKRALDAFRLEYAERLPARIVAIEADWNVVCTVKWSGENLDAVYYKIHNLHGSAATCGFRALSEGAGALEAIVKAVKNEAMAPTEEQKSEFARRLDALKRAIPGAPLE